MAADGSGVLVLSEFAGAAEELAERFSATRSISRGSPRTIELALELDEEDRRQRLACVAAIVHDHDVFWWAREEISALEQARLW